MEIQLRNYAHLGDAIWEVIVREYTVDKAVTVKTLHQMTTARVKASFQYNLLMELESILTDSEKEIMRRARNLPVPAARRNMQQEYRMATAFETLIGYWYINDKVRFEEIKVILNQKIVFEEDING